MSILDGTEDAQAAQAAPPPPERVTCQIHASGSIIITCTSTVTPDQLDELARQINQLAEQRRSAWRFMPWGPHKSP